MFQVLVAFFLLVPIVEIYLIIKVGNLIGPIPTIALIVFTAVLGAFLLRWQGLSAINRVRDSLSQGRLPAAQLLEGVLLLVGGALLLTPGFFTDTLGFLILIPPLRAAVAEFLLRRYFVVKFGPDTPEYRRDNVIEGEYRRHEE